jgi:hypothetical protein
MEDGRSFIIITILILVLVSILGLTMKALYLESRASVSVEAGVLSKEDNLMTDDIESDLSPILLVLDLTRNPPQTQITLSFLLLIPVGLLITALAKSMVGIRIIGTFSPTLLALSQARSDWRIGIVIFIVIFGLGSLCRMLLMRFRLTSVPRRGVIGTFVVCLLAVVISFSQSYGLTPTVRHVLLPVAVMTLMIDKFFTIMETEGNRTALAILANSIAVAVCCYLVFAYTRIGQILLIFPEFELMIMAVLILIGRYHRRSLLDILGFQRNKKF